MKPCRRRASSQGGRKGGVETGGTEAADACAVVRELVAAGRHPAGGTRALVEGGHDFACEALEDAEVVGRVDHEHDVGEAFDGDPLRQGFR